MWHEIQAVRRVLTSSPARTLQVALLGTLFCPCVRAPDSALASSANTATLRGESVPVPSLGSPCDGEPVILGYDGTIEAGVQWRGYGVQEDYVGAFGQAFDLGPGTLRCASIWLTQDGLYNGALSDVYIWTSGVDSEPGDVLFLLPDILFQNIPVWPAVGENRAVVELVVDGSFTVGCWGQWPGETPGRYYWATDSDGPLGPAWTLVGFDQGYPVGWQHPSVVWGEDIVHNMAMGVTFESTPVPAKASSWGRVKHFYH